MAFPGCVGWRGAICAIHWLGFFWQSFVFLAFIGVGFYWWSDVRLLQITIWPQDIYTKAILYLFQHAHRGSIPSHQLGVHCHIDRPDCRSPRISGFDGLDTFLSKTTVAVHYAGSSTLLPLCVTSLMRISWVLGREFSFPARVLLAVDWRAYPICLSHYLLMSCNKMPIRKSWGSVA